MGNIRTGDMMDLRNPETRRLITKGFQSENIKNPFIDYMIDKNSFPLSKADYVSSMPGMRCTSMGAAFFIVPFVNAITRSGTLEEKHLLFESMLTHKAFKDILSNKRGHRLGEKEKLVIQAVRTVSNVKNRQTRAEQAGMDMLENLIEKDNLLDNHILLFLLDPGQIQPEIRGLVANKLAAKYQRPCCVLTYSNDDIEVYNGSMRGYTKTGITSFKEVLERCPGIRWVQGHDNAAGMSVCKDQIRDFLSAANRLLKDTSIEPMYRVDYDFREQDNNNAIILEIAGMNDYWGQDIERAYVNIRFKITDSNFKVMKSNTLKFELPNGLSIIKFGGTDKEIEQFTTTGYIELNAVCKCNENKWNGNSYPQLIMEDWEIIDSSRYYF